MKKLMKLILAAVLLFLFLGNVSTAQDQQNKYADQTYNIEGVFVCDYNGNYYVRQIGNEILWFGEDDNVSPLWSNVAHGTINGNVLTVLWADVPKGSILQHGKLVINIDSNDKFTLTTQEGDNFGSSVWNRKTY